MLATIPENSFLSILLSDILPTLLTVIVGGLLAARVFPPLQYHFDIVKQNNQRKREISEEIIRSFEKYISDWRRLITLSSYARSTKLSEDEESRRIAFVNSRNEARDKLLGALRVGRLYFSRKTCCNIENFLKWDEEQTSSTLEQLPEIEEWRDWQQKITELLSSELRAKFS